METKSNSEHQKYLKDGLLIIKNFLSIENVQKFREILDHYFLNFKSFHHGERGRILCGFAGKTPELEELNNLHINEKIIKILNSYIFNGNEFIFAEHSDLHQNRTTGWHRDNLDFLSKERGNGCEKDLWSEKFHVIKVCFLLQDHTSNQCGMSFKLGTHKDEDTVAPPFYANTQSTDMIIFDQRILHAGQEFKKPYFDQFGKNRYLVTYAYGLDNELTRTHITGANIRQKEQQLYYK